MEEAGLWLDRLDQGWADRGPGGLGVGRSGLGLIGARLDWGSARLGLGSIEARPDWGSGGLGVADWAWVDCQWGSAGLGVQGLGLARLD